jgi:hypothetical protein
MIAPPAAAAPAFVLSGVVIGPDRAPLAWLQEPAETANSVVVVREGDRLGAYQVTRIHADRVELEGPGGRVIVPLYSRATATTREEAVAVARPMLPGTPGSVAPAPPSGSSAAAVEAFKRGLLGAMTGSKTGTAPGGRPRRAAPPGAAPGLVPEAPNAGAPAAEQLQQLFGVK